MSVLSRARGVVVPAAALALTVSTLTTPPAAAAVPAYLEPTVTVTDGPSARPESFFPFTATETQVAVRLDRSGVRLLSGPDLSVVTDVQGAVNAWNARFVGDRFITIQGDHVLVVDVTTGATVEVPTVGTPLRDTHATGWLERGTPEAPRALVLARLDGDEVTRQTIAQLPDGWVNPDPAVSPSGRRVVVQAGDGPARVLIDIDVVNGTATTTAAGAVAHIDAVTEDALVVTTTDGYRERRGTNEARWTGSSAPVVLWDGRTLEHTTQVSSGEVAFEELLSDGTRVVVPATPVLLELASSNAVQVSEALAWSSDWASGTLRRVDPEGVSDVLTMPAAPLAVRAVDVTDGTVRWLDDSATEVYGAGDVWARDLSGDTPRSLVVRRATGRSLAVNSGLTYAARVADPEEMTVELVRGTGEDDTEVLSPINAPGRMSTAAGRVGVSGYPTGKVVDTASGATSDVPSSFEIVAGEWDVAMASVGVSYDSTRVTATAGTEKRVAEVRGYFTEVRAVGTRIVLQTATPGGGITTSVFDLADAAGPHVTRLSAVGIGERLLAAGRGRIVTQDDLTDDLFVRSLYDGTLLARLKTGGHPDPVVAIDGSWVTWTTTGPDGDRLVAAPLAGTPSPTFTDVSADHPFSTEISWLVEAGIAEGYFDGSFGAVAPVSRQAMAAFLYRAAGSPEFTAPATASFSDVPTTNPFFREVEWLADSEVAGGYTDGTFRPTAPVSRQAMAAFLHRYAGEPAVPADAPTFPDVQRSNEFRDAIRWLASTEVTTGYTDGTFRPAAAVSRQAMAAFLYRYDQLDD